jgi:predicted GH43/DUF377 family glycosyl hydrolase
MILINKVTPFANETFQKDLLECILHNASFSFISNIIIFHNNANISLPKHSKIKLIIKSNFSDKDIIEYCKKITTDDIFIFSNPFIKFNNSLINLEKPLMSVNKVGNDCFIFNRNETLIGSSIDDIFKMTNQNNKISVNRTHIWTEEIKNFNINKKSELVFIDNIKLNAIIVSVNYNDFLSITLESISNLMNVTVVTSPDDTVCQQLCKRFRVNCVVTDKMYDEDAKFNKGKAINEGLKSINNPDWILLLDADIYLQPNFLDVLKSSKNDINSLIICKRLILDNYDDFVKWKNGEDVGQIERAKGYGYFQLFNAKCSSNRSFFYSEKYTDASESDLEFRDRFKLKKELDTCVVHLGNTGKNWFGRITENFKKLKLPIILSNDICKFEGLVKKNIRIVSNIEFNLTNGGIYNPGLFYKNNKKYIICRCEKNFESYLGVYEKYWSSLINPMYFQIDDDFNIIDFGVFKMCDFPILMRYEDFRVFEYQDKIISNHSIINPNYNYKGEDSWPNMNICTKPGIFISVNLSEIDVENQSIVNNVSIKLESNYNTEKNWSFFSEDDELFFIYSLDPFIVYKRGKDNFIKIIDKKFEYNWNIDTDSMKYCISTNLKRLDNEYYILLFHTKTDNYKYVQGCMLLDNNFTPKYMTKNPILESEKMIGKYTNVLYAFSVDIKDDEIHVYYGEADTNCCVAIIDKKILLDNLLNSDNSHKIKEIEI